MTPVRTACPYCGVGCGITATVTGSREVDIAGDDAHPTNSGRLCSKGTHLGETVGLEGRLLHPMITGRRTGWDETLDHVAQHFADTAREHGPDSVAFYVSGQLLTEDYYVANKLMKGFIGSGNIDTNSRLCMASAVAAHNRAFGEDVVPCSYDDLHTADLILLVGSSTAWCHPIVWQRIEHARAARGTRLVVIDPRRTETAECADLHIAIAPDGDVALFNALLLAMRARGLIDADYLEGHVAVPHEFWTGLSGDARCAGIADADLEALVELVAASPNMVTLFGQGANQSVAGTDKGNAIINLHLATGRIGKPGAGPFSITGQPNAMGGREVGGLASTLAVHMGFSDEERATAQTFWNSPTVASGPGMKAIDMFRAVHDGRIKALWVMATNPAVSMPDAGFVREALAKCEFLVVSDVIADTDTARHADVLLPALAWGEKDGMVTASDRMMTRQRALFPPPGECRADWRIISGIAARMGFGDAFAYRHPVEIFREYAAQTAFANHGKRMLDIGEWAAISAAEYDAWEPERWGGASPFAAGRYSTPDGRARMIAVRPTVTETNPAFPLRLNTGRYRDQWHTMTRTGLSPRLSRHRPEPLLEIHPDDAAAASLTDGGLARVVSAFGSSVFRVQITDAQRTGEIFAPMHWTDQTSSGGRVNRLPGSTADLFSGQPAFKNVAVRVEDFAPEWQAFLVTHDTPATPADGIYWTRSRLAGGWLVELAGHDTVDIDALLPAGERVEAVDLRRGMRRIAVRRSGGSLAAALFVTRSGTLPARDWIASQLTGEEPGGGPLAWIAGRPSEPAPDRGAIVCVCFDVGMKTILGAIADQQLASVEAVGTALRAGTNCGSCRSAISRLIADTAPRLEAAE